ncbi:MAG: GNAT family N-acetyltransferase [Geminicoccaceae bacterium]
MADIRIERLSGADLIRLLPDLARLRITVFRDFPYLYEGSQAYEEKYVRTYAENEGSVVVAAFDGDKVVGASTGVPLIREPDSVQAPFVERGMDPASVFYFGESVLLKSHRGHGIGVRFFEEREAHARALGGFERTCFCGVVRPADHPRRPPDYVPLNDFWRKRGYRPMEGFIGHITWKDLDEAEASPKPMQFWTKEIA